MFVLTVDSSRNDMEILTQCIKKELPDAVICGVPFAKEAYKLASNRKVDLALIDMELGGEDSTQGMELAERLMDLSEDTVIMFTSSEEKHAVDAYRVHAEGFILKPLTEEKVEDELAHYKKTTLKRKEVKHDLRIRCFGNFACNLTTVYLKNYIYFIFQYFNFLATNITFRSIIGQRVATKLH